MYCPSCGAEDRQSSQFCRKCGVNLQAIYVALQKPELALTSGRDEVYRAVAARIREEKEDLSTIVEKILPKLEETMASPEEYRLRQLRAGVLFAAGGFGLALYLLLRQFVLTEGGFALMAAFVAFFVGLGHIINGWMFCLPSRDWSINLEADSPTNPLNPASNNRSSPDQALISGIQHVPPSPTEGTTRNLTEETKVNTSPMQ